MTNGVRVWSCLEAGTKSLLGRLITTDRNKKYLKPFEAVPLTSGIHVCAFTTEVESVPMIRHEGDDDDGDDDEDYLDDDDDDEDHLDDDDKDYLDDEIETLARRENPPRL